MKKLKHDEGVLARDSAEVAIDSLLDVMGEVGRFCADVQERLIMVQNVLRGSPVRDDRASGGSDVPVENAEPNPVSK
jgi:hypothetical protein